MASVGARCRTVGDPRQRLKADGVSALNVGKSIRIPQWARVGSGGDRGGGWKRGALVLVTWDQRNLAFLVVHRGRGQLRAGGSGIVRRGGEVPPLKQLREVLETRQLRGEKLAIVAPRTQLEVATVEVPAADGGELAALVQGEVDAQLGDGEQSLVSDFCRLDGHPGQRASLAALARGEASSTNGDGGTPQGDAPVTVSAAAFALEQAQLERWRTLAEEHGFALQSVTSRQVAPLASLQRAGLLERRLTVLVAIYAGEVELTFLRGNRPALLRTFRVASDTVSSLAEQIQIEVQRSLSMVDLGAAAGDAELVLLERDHGDLGIITEGDGESVPSNGENEPEEVELGPGTLTDDQWRELIETLDARSIALRPSELQWDESAGVDRPEPSLVAAAVDLAESGLAIDLMHPKQPAAPPNPVRRWSLIGALAAVSLGIVGYFLWSDVQVLRKDVEAAEDELGKAEQMAAKLQEKADETRFVQQWLGDQVDWLDQLQRLSRQFPDGQGANVRRLSAKLEGEYGVFDLSIQVSDPSRVAALENRLRSADFAVTSEQISEQAANAEYPWQFEARVAFPLEPLAERERDSSLVAGASLQFPGADEASQETLASGTAASAGAAGEGDSASGPADPATDGSEAATQATPDDPPAANDGGPAS